MKVCEIITNKDLNELMATFECEKCLAYRICNEKNFEANKCSASKVEYLRSDVVKKPRVLMCKDEEDLRKMFQEKVKICDQMQTCAECKYNIEDKSEPASCLLEYMCEPVMTYK